MSIKRFNPTLCRGRVWGVIITVRAAQRGLTWALGSLSNSFVSRAITCMDSVRMNSPSMSVAPTHTRSWTWWFSFVAVLLISYPLSVPPVVWMGERNLIPHRWIINAYVPLLIAMTRILPNDTPLPKPFDTLIEWLWENVNYPPPQPAPPSTSGKPISQLPTKSPCRLNLTATKTFSNDRPGNANTIHLLRSPVKIHGHESRWHVIAS
ncbi:MAG: hypothetical protein JWN70_929 [Planctomycetaceae bacterium]|nr:hypothetical protein [Planctomycetaceae bacterium]